MSPVVGGVGILVFLFGVHVASNLQHMDMITVLCVEISRDFMFRKHFKPRGHDSTFILRGFEKTLTPEYAYQCSQAHSPKPRHNVSSLSGLAGFSFNNMMSEVWCFW